MLVQGIGGVSAFSSFVSSFCFYSENIQELKTLVAVAVKIPQIKSFYLLVFFVLASLALVGTVQFLHNFCLLSAFLKVLFFACACVLIRSF